MSAPLTGVRVLDLSDGIAGSHCARLFATGGAAVIKVEPPEGDPLRRSGPFPGDLPDREKSGVFLHLNAAKSSATLDIGNATGRDLLLRLAGWADLVVESFAPGRLASLGLGYDVLRDANPRLVLTSITPFGQTGPYRDYSATEIGLHAISGELSLAGQPREPLKKGGNIALFLGGLYGFLGSMAALFQREETGRGQHVDVSVAEGFMSIIGGPLHEQSYNGGRPPGRRPGGLGWPNGIRLCKDGYVMVFTAYGVGDAWWPGFAKMISDGAEVEIPRAQPRDPEEQKPWDERLTAWLAARTRREAHAQAQRRGLAFGYLATAPDALASPQLAHRRFFTDVDHPAAGRLTMTGLPFLIDGERLALAPAPLLGEHNEVIYGGVLGLGREDMVRLRALGVI